MATLLAKGPHHPTEMPDLIQFECPACASTLRIPIELSGQDGPCPVCQQIIFAPNPYTGVGAYLAVATLNPPQEAEAYAPAFADPEPEPVIRLEPVQRQKVAPLPQPTGSPEPQFTPQASFEPSPETAPQPQPFTKPEPSPAQEAPTFAPAAPPFEAPLTPQPAEAETPPTPENQPFPDRLIPRDPSQEPTVSNGPPLSHFDIPASPSQSRPGSRKGLIFAALGILMVALAGGAFLLKDQLFGSSELDAPLNASHPPIPPPPSIPSINPPVPHGTPDSPQNPAAAPAPTPEGASAKPPAEPSPDEPTKVVASAEAVLKAFLAAPDWASRSAYVLSPESVRPKMEAYAKDNPDGPTAFESFSVKHSQVDEKTGSTLFVFQVEASNAPAGIPVAILETAKGWLVDWESFVEFRDDQFKHFTEGPVDLKGDFHLIVTAPQGPPGTAQENENFAGFSLSPPLPDRQRTAFVRKSNPIYQQLKEATADGRVFTPVLEVAKRNAGDKQSYLEILSIKATDWRPKEQ